MIDHYELLEDVAHTLSLYGKIKSVLNKKDSKGFSTTRVIELKNDVSSVDFNVNVEANEYVIYMLNGDVVEVYKKVRGV